MKKIAFLTMDDVTGFCHDDHLALPPLKDLGIEVEMVDWQDSNRDWNAFEMIVIRSTYNYIHNSQQFCSVLQHIENQGTALANPAAVVAWNQNKQYLLELANLGVACIPSQVRQQPNLEDLVALGSQWQTNQLVFKPLVGATAHGIQRFDTSTGVDAACEALSVYANQSFLIQPFLPTIQTAGEWSLFFFNKKYSHAVVKKPKPGDYRVQEEFGGEATPETPSQQAIAIAEHALQQVNHPLLYARVDLVPFEKSFLLMELELIEPQLFLKCDQQAPQRFANHIAESLEQGIFSPKKS